jgi:hypothetical protein
MSQLRCDITITLDGYVAGPNQSIENPLGEGADEIHDWALKTRAFAEKGPRRPPRRGVGPRRLGRSDPG